MKDCSILVGIRDNGATQKMKDALEIIEYSVEYKGAAYLASVAIVDIEQKPLSKLSKYQKLDEEIVQHYMNSKGLHDKMCNPNIVFRGEDVPPKDQIVRIKGSLMCRVLYPNPVCILSCVCAQKLSLNVMTITWLTPIDNHVRP